ncbi:MAG: hypothetical protein HC886_23410, partial [Leptolyngbyaceae cyanobacterium SM1_1_3]|nr:hypothetical protein [Leptolyngbyaceae cyanobacterium SM1_1_3]
QPQGDRPSPSRDYTAQVSDNQARRRRRPRSQKQPKTNSRDRAAQETDWQTFRSPETWNDWGEQPDASAPPPRQPPRSRRQREQYQVEDSLNELTEGWQDWQDEPATASDAVDPDALASDWEDWTEADAAPSEQRGPVERDYEVQSPPKRAYQSGSIYSYSYRGEAERANVADTPADEIPDEMDNAEAESGGRVAADGVYEADYRVIVPPYRNLDETDG